MKSPKYFFNENIVELALANTFFKKEVFTGNHSQIVLMSVAPGQEIGKEIHRVDQILFFADGQGIAILNDVISEVFPYHMVFVPAGVEHNFKNTGERAMKICTIYAPVEDKPGTAEEKKPR
jgi:mannose-6-phosphate isomerase-like protein (cupin superfamily)